jgi:multidrug efflux pump subunit AcrB
MVVDDAIVVFENIFRQRERGVSLKEAAKYGASEVGTAVTASTITILAVVAPIIFVPGITGVMFKQMGMVIILVMIASLFVSLTLTPMLSSVFLKITHGGSGRMGRLFESTEKFWVWTETFYSEALHWSLNHKKTIIIGGLLIFFSSLGMLKFVGTEFMPEMDQGMLNGAVELPLGSRLEESDKVMLQVEDIIRKEAPETEVYYIMAGRSENNIGGLLGRKEDYNVIMVGGKLVKKLKRKRSSAEVNRIIGMEVAKLPGLKSTSFTATDQMNALIYGSDKPITVEIYGESFEDTDMVAARVAEMVSTVPGAIEVELSRLKGKPELWIKVDREKASAHGLSMGYVASIMRTYFYGEVASRFRISGDEYDIMVKLRPENRQSFEDVGNVLIPPVFKMPFSIPGMPTVNNDIQVSNIATLVKETGPLDIERKAQSRIIKVGANTYKRALGDVANDVREKIKNVALPEGVSMQMGGTAEEQVTAFRTLTIAFFLGMLLVYMVMAAEFESFIHPLIILMAVPFAVTGVIWALLLTGTNLGLVCFIGMILLIGVVVRNTIMLVDYTNILRQRGFEMENAVRTAGTTRLRPVLMTALACVLGMLPLATSKSEGAEFWNPLGITVVGGMMVSTFITLLFVPVMYSIVETWLEERKKTRAAASVGRT